MNLRILIAEDQPNLLDILCDYFRSKSDEPVSFAALTRSVAKRFAPMLEEKGLTVSYDLGQLLPGRLRLQRKPGTGLGFALVKRVVELHRGTCTVRNAQASPDGVLPTAVEFGFSLSLV